ncbi:MAG: hypothetical protein U0736_04185 [Gemmataceae bacterium]
MSEYQYYEFMAIDRPLDPNAMADLRQISSRARITPTSLTNVYNYGDFRDDPDRLMDRYFDAHLYVANWGSRRLMLRLPAAAFPLALAKPYAIAETMTARATADHVILTLQTNPEEWGGSYEEGEGWLAPLLSLRSELLAGDLRCLYLGWLAAIDEYVVEDEDVEPPVPPGLQQLSAPLTTLAEFLRLDPDLLGVAAAGSVGEPPVGPTTADLAAWIATLPTGEKDRMVMRVMQGEGSALAGELHRRFREGQRRTAASERPDAPRRTAGELRAASERAAEERKRKEAERAARARERRARELAAAREQHLDTLVGREDELWRQVDQAIAARLPKEYDRAIEMLKDLRDLATRAGQAEGVTARIRALREQHQRKRTLLKRFDRANLPQ